MSEQYQPKNEQSKNFVEENLKRVRRRGQDIILGEGQSAFDDGHKMFLLGPMDSSRNIDTFETLESGYNILSEGYLGCVEITGSIGSKKFLIHAIDKLQLKKQLHKIAELVKGEEVDNITMRFDEERVEIEEFLKEIKKVFGQGVEIEEKSFLDP